MIFSVVRGTVLNFDYDRSAGNLKSPGERARSVPSFRGVAEWIASTTRNFWSPAGFLWYLLVRQWKLVIRGEMGTAEDQSASEEPRRKRGKAEREPVELFNLADDPYEKTNLAAKHPEKVEQLRARYELLASQAMPPKSAPKASGFQSPKVWGQE